MNLHKQMQLGLKLANETFTQATSEKKQQGFLNFLVEMHQNKIVNILMQRIHFYIVLQKNIRRVIYWVRP